MSDSKTMKVVLIGNSDVGKTCLVERFLRERWKSDTQPTIGSAFGAKAVRVSVHGQQYQHNVGVWDTAGSERYYSMTQHYYKGSHAALVCYDLTDRKSWDKVDFWVKELRAVEEDAVVSIVGTKLDLLQDGSGHQRGIMRQFVVDYANKIGARSFETSALTGKNVDMVFTETVRSFVKFHPGYKKFAGKPKDKAVDLRQSQSGGGSARGSAGDDGGCACTF